MRIIYQKIYVNKIEKELLVIGTDTGKLIFYSITDNKTLFPNLRTHVFSINSLSLINDVDELLIVSAGHDKTIRLWNLEGVNVKYFKTNFTINSCKYINELKSFTLLVAGKSQNISIFKQIDK